MRIAIAAPWNTKSAIAQSASEVAFELAARGHIVVSLRTETGASIKLPVRPAPGAIHHINEYQDERLDRDFDLILANFGDNYEFHGAILQHLGAPGLVGIFHDASMPHLMQGWIGDVSAPESQDRREVARKFSHLWDPDVPAPAETVSPLEWLARRVIGGVAHAHHYADALRDICPGPVIVVPLAFEVADLPPPPLPSRMTTIAAVGHANSNRRIDKIILAISASYLLRTRCRLRIIGAATPSERRRLTDLAQDLEIEPPAFTGWVSDGELRRQLRDVDVISCLRHPALEGASASVILGLLSGRPVLVTNQGCYTEIPSDAALFCSPYNDALDILTHLEHLVRNPDFGIRTGQRGLAFASGRHTASAYVDALGPLLEYCIAMRPVQNAKNALAATLAEFGLDRGDLAVARSAKEVNELVYARSLGAA